MTADIALGVCLFLAAAGGLAHFFLGGAQVRITDMTLATVLLFIVYFLLRFVIRRSWAVAVMMAIFLTSNWGMFIGAQLTWLGHTELMWYTFRIMGALTGLLIIAALVFASKIKSAIQFRRSRMDKLVLFYAAFMPWQLIMGLVHKNPMTLIVGDCFLWICGPLTYAAIRKPGLQAEVDGLWNNVAVVFLWASLYNVSLQWVEYLATGVLKVQGGATLMVPACYYFAMVILKGAGTQGNMGLLVSIICLIISLKRGPMISFGASVAATVLVIPGKDKVRIIFLLLLVVSVLMVASKLTTDSTSSRLKNIIEDRYRSMDADNESNPVSLRFREASLALDTLERSESFLNYISGMGAGAEVYGPKSAGASGIADTTRGYFHSIHMTPVSIYFRSGVMGLLAAGLVFGGGLLLMLRTTRRIFLVPQERRMALVTSQVWMMAACVDSLKAYGLVPQTLVWLSLATYANYESQEMAGDLALAPAPQPASSSRA